MTIKKLTNYALLFLSKLVERSCGLEGNDKRHNKEKTGDGSLHIDTSMGELFKGSQLSMGSLDLISRTYEIKKPFFQQKKRDSKFKILVSDTGGVDMYGALLMRSLNVHRIVPHDWCTKLIRYSTFHIGNSYKYVRTKNIYL